MSLEVCKKRKDVNNDNNQDRLKIPKLIPIKKILSSGKYVSNCVKNKKSSPVLDNNNNNKTSNNSQSYSSSYKSSPPNLIDVSDRAQTSSLLVDKETNYSLSIDTNLETNSKKTQTKFVRQSFLLITLIDHNKILRAYCHETTSSKISENKCNCNDNALSNNKLIQSNTNNNNLKLISPIRLTKSKDGSWHSTEVTKNSVQDLAIQTEISFSLERTVLTVSNYEAELEFVKNLLQNQETISKRPLITQLNDLKLHLINYPIRDPILIPKNSFQKLLENPYKNFLELMLNKPQYYFEKNKAGIPDNFYDTQFNSNENNNDCYLITFKSFEEILKTYENSTKQIKEDFLKSSQKDVDEIDTERTALFNQLTLMKYLPSKSLNNNNYNNFNNFNNVPDQLLKKLFFNGTTINSKNNNNNNQNHSNISQNNRVPKFFSNSNSKNSTRKMSRISDLSKRVNSGQIIQPPFDYLYKNTKSLDARCAALYDFPL